jgi:hypothetical protein
MALSDTVSIISAVVAFVSLAFAWKAVKTADKNNSIALFTELHGIYQSDSTFAATQQVWELYKRCIPSADGTPISEKQALQFVEETDRSSKEWKAVHDASTFWRYLTLLVNERFIDQELAFHAFASPAILGFLYPIERAFLSEAFDYRRSLQSLYDRWKIEKARKGKK